MFCPFCERWIQPFATFASRGAVPGDAIWRLCLKQNLLFTLLHPYGSIVTPDVCDGAQSNKSIYNLADKDTDIIMFFKRFLEKCWCWLLQ